MMNESEVEFFNVLCREHRLSEKPLGQQELYVHSFLLAVQIRRCATDVYAGKANSVELSRLIQLHAVLMDKCGKCVGYKKGAKRKSQTATTAFGIDDYFALGDDEDPEDITF